MVFSSLIFTTSIAILLSIGGMNYGNGEKEKGKQKVLAMNEILGDTYRSYRKAKGLTQEKSAELAKVTDRISM